MPALNIKFDRHGLGDCVHFAHALQLYKRRGYDITVQAEENKLFVWKVAGVNIVQGGGLPDHSYHYPAGFDDLNLPDCDTNKVAFGLRHDVMPPLEDLGLTPQQAWDELCDVRLSAHDFIPPEAHQEAEAFLAGLPRPIICFHSRGTNWHERKSLPTDVAFDVILQLLDQTGGSVVVLDFDHRAPMVGHERCKGIKPTWGHIGIDRLCALYERSDLMIGVDSGPFHVASLTNVKTLGVFRSLHPNRVCLPNPNTVYLAAIPNRERLNTRNRLWQFKFYASHEPTPAEIVKQARTLLSKETCSADLQPDVAFTLGRLHCTPVGRHTYRRIHHENRPVELLSDGTILGGGDCERTWTFQHDVLSIIGIHGVIARLQQSKSGVWRGRWTKFERMPVELVPEGISFNDPSKTTPVQMSTTGFQFLNYEDLTRSVRKLAAQLATPMAVAGIPRAGELVATMLAEHFAVPKIPLDEALSCNPYLPDQRRAHLRSTNDFVLIVDDTVWGGHAMSYCRSCADPQANLRFACVFSTPENRHLVDYWAEEHPRSLNMFEWNMLREPWAHHAYCDLDGVICSDWNGSESLTPDTYLNHINQARVLYAPTKPIGAVVTGRLECFRPQTEEWLARNHIQFHKLIMYPSADARVRDNDDIGAWKGQFFRDDSNARVFFESDLGQSNRIHDISQKPVVFFPERRLLS